MLTPNNDKKTHHFKFEREIKNQTPPPPPHTQTLTKKKKKKKIRQNKT